MMTDPVVPIDPQLVLAIDPGKDKCGVAVVAVTGEVVERHIYGSRNLQDVLPSLVKKYGISEIVLGNATTAQRMREQLAAWLPLVHGARGAERGATRGAGG